jgi:hypothetical protein
MFLNAFRDLAHEAYPQTLNQKSAKKHRYKNLMKNRIIKNYEKTPQLNDYQVPHSRRRRIKFFKTG